MAKIGLKSAVKRKWETLAISLMLAFSLGLYVTSSILKSSLLPLFSNYLRMSYGDIIVLGYIPYYADALFSNASFVKDFTGYAVVPSYGYYHNQTIPLLLGFTEAAYRNNTLLGGFKAPPLKPGQAVLLRESASFLKPNMELKVYPMVTIRPVKPFKEKIVGYAEGGLPLPAGPVLFLNKDDGEELVKEFGGYTVYSVILRDDLTRKAALRKTMDLLKEAGAYVALTFYTKKDLLFYPGEDVILETSNVLKFLSNITWIVVTAIIIIVAILYVERNVREIAGLRALGASSWDMAQYLLSLWGSRALLGTALAFLIGYAIAVQAINAALSHPRLQPLKAFVHISTNSADVGYVVAMALVTVVLTVLVSLLVIARMNVAEAMRFYGLKVKLDVESFLPFNAMIAVSEVRSVLWRSLAGMVLLSLTLSLIVIPYTLGNSLRSIEYPKSFDVSVTFLRIPKISPPVPFLIEQLRDVNGTKSLSIWVENLYGSVNFKSFIRHDGKWIPVYAMSCVEALKGKCTDVGPRLIKGKYPSGNEIAVSNLLANELGLEPNQTLKIMIQSHNVTRVYEVKVSGIVADPVFPPTIILPRSLLPKKLYNVMVVYALTDNETAVAKELQGIMIGNAYAAASLTWKSYYSNLLTNLNFVARSVTMTTFISLSIIVLAVLTFTFSDTVIKSKFLATLKALGSTTRDYYITSLTRWLIIAVLASLLTPVVSYAASAWGVRVLSEVYLVKVPRLGAWMLILPLLTPPVLALVDSLWFKRIEVSSHIKESN